MPHRGKRYLNALKLVEPGRAYPMAEAVETLQKFPRARFAETVEMTLHLGVDPRQPDQMVRGTVRLPHGSGKSVRVLVFATGPQAEAAQAAGADWVGYEELVRKIQDGWTDFDVAIATPATMQEVRKLGRILGPRGLMPNPRVGTVTDDVVQAVGEVKAGKVEFKVDRTGNLHVPVGKSTFTAQQLLDNAMAVWEAIVKARPASAKGQFIQSATISGTMSPGVKLDVRELTKG